MSMFKEAARVVRVKLRVILGREPNVKVRDQAGLTYFGSDYGGWAIPASLLNSQSVVVDAGLGEDISFSQTLIGQFGVQVHGLDPTPRSIIHCKRLSLPNFTLHEVGLGATNGNAIFYLPNNESFVSGSIHRNNGLGKNSIEVELISVAELFALIRADKIDLLKIDIEGSEYEVFQSVSFADFASRIGIICVEFHHRWREFGCTATTTSVKTLREKGFECIWKKRSTNEEFTFINRAYSFS